LDKNVELPNTVLFFDYFFFFQDFSDPMKLLSSGNIDRDRLLEFARSAVHYATDHQLPEDLEFKQLSNGQPDIALFDFTSIKKASNASRIIERKKKKLLMTLVGDSLLEVQYYVERSKFSFSL